MTPNATTLTLVEAAADYAARGWRVFPCEPRGKRPIGALVPHGLKDATTDPAVIRAWWAAAPDANIGCVCGDSFEVVDLDTLKANGPAVAQAKYGFDIDAHPGPVSRTQSGGYHAFCAPNGKKTRTLPDDIGDLKAGEAYVILPPSVGPKGKYEWVHDPDIEPNLPPTPVWATTHVTRAPAPAAEGVVFKKGERQTRMFKIVGGMRRQGATYDAILAALREQNRQCAPPLADAELRGMAKSGVRYSPADDAPRLTDMGNGRRLAERHGHEMRFCFEWNKWLCYDGKRWAEDLAAAREHAKDTVRGMYAEAGASPDDNERRKRAEHALSSESRSRIDAMLTMAQSEPGMPVKPQELDRDPFLLNVQNGTLDLRTGSLRPHDSADMLTKLAPVEYHPDAPCLTWLAFLNRIMDGNERLIDFLRRALGYCLTGDVREQIMLFFFGRGANGKSTLLNAYRDTMGPDYSCEAAPDLLMSRVLGEHPTAVAALFGMRFVSTIEVDEGKKLAEVLFKQLTGGDQITARRMRENYWSFKPTHKIVLAANHRPEIHGTDLAVWRRIRLVPFAVTIPEAERDKTLPDKLRAEAAGILAWAVQGCLDWQEGGLDAPPEVVAATENYRSEQDAVGNFIADRCVALPTARVKSSDLYAAFETWHRHAVGGDVPSQRAVAYRLAERGFQPERTGAARWWIGLGLRDDA